jgi:hypothetical protein
MSAEEFI